MYNNSVQYGFSPSFIAQIEADVASPSLASLEKIASALGVTRGQLLSSLEHNAADGSRRCLPDVYDDHPTN
ncbi:helix-turn-helix domain-containing protein [Candidatus Chloroploca mongolica]|uniref:helix-turn-helix domain-containing protein n=1 Tax=Candidatus Chloroploca mongolica TaxID=2528176 RepID=UPI003530CCFC